MDKPPIKVFDIENSDFSKLGIQLSQKGTVIQSVEENVDEDGSVIEFYKISVKNLKEIRKEVFVFGLHHSQQNKWESLLIT